jgi:hypothetical protein
MVEGSRTVISVAVALMLAVVLAGCAGSEPAAGPPSNDAGTTNTPTSTSPATGTGDSCPGHWHATMKVFIPEGEVDFSAYSLEQGTTPLATHMHQGDKRWRWHFEPAEARCIAFSTLAQVVDMEVSATTLTLGGRHVESGQAGAWQADGNLQIWLRHAPPPGPGALATWQDLAAERLLARQLLDCERVLIAVAPDDVDLIRSYEEQVPAAC